jgi:hypothetical protein
MFHDATTFNGDTPNGMSLVTYMNGMFLSNAFNDISEWDVSSVTKWALCSTERLKRSMAIFPNGRLFRHHMLYVLRKAFNGDISRWDVPSVTMIRYVQSGDGFEQTLCWVCRLMYHRKIQPSILMVV